MLLVLTLGQVPRGAPSESTATPVVDLQVSLIPELERPTRGAPPSAGQASIAQLHQGHVQAVLTRFVASPSDTSTQQLAARFARLRSALAATQSFDAGRCAAAPSRVAAWFELDAPELLAAEPDDAISWTARGVRVFGLAGRLDSTLASSAFPSGPARVVGLSSVGRRVVETIVRGGGLVDVANLSDAALLDVLDIAQRFGAPVVATRGSARTLRRRPGSFSDAQLRAIAAGGGVVAVTLDRDALGTGSQVGVADVVRHLRHMIAVAGPDAVALASGFDTGSVPPVGLAGAARFPALAEALTASGVARETVRKVFHDNALRVLCAAEASGETATPEAEQASAAQR